MDAPSIQSLTVVSRPYWTVRVSREETLVIREKFRKVGWRPPNHKPKKAKLVASAKSLWDRYVVPGDLQAVSRYVWLTACHEVHAHEGFCEDLARQITVARLFQRQLGFRRRHT